MLEAPDEFEKFAARLEKIREFVDIPEGVWSEILSVKRFVEVAIPVKMDNGATKIFRGFRSQYNNARGPFKGGIRYHERVNEPEIKALSALMALKTAVAGLPLGGGKGGVIVNPKELSVPELERLSRGYVRALHPLLGAEIDVAAPDVNTDGKVMAWMLDEFEKIKGCKEPGMITGKPLSLGGSKAREYSTAQGAMYVIDEAVKRIGIPTDATVAIQGFGNAGRNVAKMLHKKGYKIISVSDSSGTIINCRGLDITDVEKYKDATKKLAGYPGAGVAEENMCVAQDALIFIPAALENSVTGEDAVKIKARLVAELANSPLTKEAEEILNKREISVIPDILTNTGGVVVSYFEQVQNANGNYWEEEEVLEKLEKVMRKAFEEVWDIKEKKKTTLRNAALILAVSRIGEAIMSEKS